MILENLASAQLVVFQATSMLFGDKSTSGYGLDMGMKTGSTPGAVHWQREKQARSRLRRLYWFDDGISTELRDEPRAFVVYAPGVWTALGRSKRGYPPSI